MINITDVRVRKVDGDGKLRAVVSITNLLKPIFSLQKIEFIFINLLNLENTHLLLYYLFRY